MLLSLLIFLSMRYCVQLIAIHLARNTPNVASTDIHVIDQRRNWRRYADPLQQCWLYRTIAHVFQDVTTRGSFYPDKTLATAAVSNLHYQPLQTRMADQSRILPSTSTLLPPRRKASNKRSKRSKSLCRRSYLTWSMSDASGSGSQIMKEMNWEE